MMRARLVTVVLASMLVPAGSGCTRGTDAEPIASAPSTVDPTSTMPVPLSPTTTIVPTSTTSGTSTTSVATTSTTTTTSTTSTTTIAPTTAAPATTAAATTTAAPTTGPATTVAPAPAVVIERGTSGRHEIALTFDAGSDVGSTVEILDRLAAEGIRGSFGMTGAWAEVHPELVARMVDEGHVLINHTQTHPEMTELTTEQRLRELAAADATVAAIAGRTMQPYFRPPFGDWNASVLTDIARAGYRYSIHWTVDSLGWQGLEPADVTRRCLDGAVDGGIVLMHVGSLSTDAAALPDVIAGLRADGYAFVTVTQLLLP